MTKTRNIYHYPIEREKIIRISYDESPAHVDSLAHSIDFIVPENTPIKAAADGTVVDVKSDSNIGGTGKEFESLGNYIEIQHANEEYSEYEHLMKGGTTVKVGDKVRQGQIIGYSGATGWIATLGPHLHFMVGVYGETEKDYQTLEVCWDTE